MSALPGPVRVERDGAVAVIVIDSPPVNAASHAVRSALLKAVRDVATSDAQAGVILGAGKTFVSGADIREFDLPPEPPSLPDIIAALMEAPKPFVAALHGWALGGGLELALGCDLRLAHTGTRVGFPETTLGMIPGAGGTQHVPRLAGIAKAIEIICSGRRIDAAEALRLGLVDRLVEGDLRAEAVAAARIARKRRLRDLPVPPEDESAIASAMGSALAPEAGAQIAAAIEAIRASATLPYPTAMAREREVFLRLRASPEAAALRAKFVAARKA